MLSGTLLILLCIWGALIAYVGPYFGYAFTPDRAWSYTAGRLWLEVLPGAITILGGVLLLASRRRHIAGFGAFIAVVSGAWYVVGPATSRLWKEK